jgi:hypothetical protein
LGGEAGQGRLVDRAAALIIIIMSVEMPFMIIRLPIAQSYTHIIVGWRLHNDAQADI